MTPLTTKRKERWNWKQIKQVIEDVYKIEGSSDSWGIQVVCCLLKKKKYPATCVVHWPSGAVNACNMHAQALINLSRMLGNHIVATKLEKPAECVNCKNEAGLK